MTNLDVPTFERRGGLPMEPVGMVGKPHETRAEGVRPPSLSWSSSPPLEPGWYWQRTSRDSSAIPMLVFERGRYLYALDPGGKHEWDVRAMRCAWAGPMLEPEP